jgi:hypothetical protein
MEKKNSGADVKKRYWAFVLYPESAPADWRSEIQQRGLVAAVSPLHDRDVNPTGEKKKPHYHVILAYPGPTTYKSVERLTSELGQPIPQPLESIEGYYRYFTHKDNPEKAQYDELQIEGINGFDISSFVELTKKEVQELKIKIQLLIRECNIVEYAELMDILLDREMLTEYEIACNHTYFFDRYICSRRCKLAQDLQ